MEISRFFNIEAEVNILGAVFRDNNVLCSITDFLRSDDFYNPRHKLIYYAAVKLYEEGKPIDVVSLCEKLGISLVEAGGVSYLSELYSSSLPSHKASYYGEIIKEKANIRRLMDLLENEKEKVKSKDKSCDEIMDRMLGGFNREEFIILAARPSMGKTAMALNLALNAALREKAKVAFFNLEMGKNQIIERALSILGEINCRDIKKGSLSDEDWIKVMKASRSLSGSSLYIYDKVFSLRGSKNECKRLKIQKGLDIVIIDYLQLINSEERAENRNIDISKISRELKLLAKELDVTVIALSQLSRAPEGRINHRPMLSDLRESGSLEQDADVVMFLYRDAYYNRDTEDKDVIENIIAKNRNGQVGIVKLKWFPQYQRVE